MKVNKIILKLKKTIKLDSIKIGVAKITPVGTINIQENGTYDVTNYNEAVVNTPTPSGQLEITTNGEYDVSNYKTANVNCSSDLDWSEIGYSERPNYIENGYNYAKQIKDNWDASITNLSYKFQSNYNLIFMPIVDFSKVASAYGCFQHSSIEGEFKQNDCSALSNIRNMFSYCYSIRKIKMYKLNSLSGYSNDAFRGCNSLNEIYLDAPETNLTSVTYMFGDCVSLKTINLFDTSKATNFNNMFSNCSSLENVPIFDLSSATNISNMFYNCNALTDESLNNIMKMCIGATSYNGTKTLKIMYISQGQATRCQNLSNYQDFINAGWTTGY